MVIDVALCKRSAEPTQQRATPGVRRQRRAAFAIVLTKTVELGVERVREIVAQRSGAGDGNSSLRERSAIEPEKTLPRSLTAKSAGVRESEFV